MKKSITELLQEKNYIYESIIQKLKEHNFEMMIKFEEDFKKIDELNKKINQDNISEILNIRL